MSPLPAGTVVRDPVGSFGKRVLGFAVVATIPVILSYVFFGVLGIIELALLVALLLAIFAKDSLVAALRWHRPTMQLSSTPYALGSTPTIVYRRKPKRVLDISPCNIDCLLVCEERVTYTHGTDTMTETRKVYESRSVGVGEGTAEGLIAEITLDVSAHKGAPSFKMPSNEVVWFVEASISGPRLPRGSHRFVIDVAPVLDPTHRVGVGLELDDLVCPVGHQFTGRLIRQADADGISQTSKARGVRLVLRVYTEGRGDVDKRDVSSSNFDLEPHGGLSATFSLAVPLTSPISYDGSLIRVKYEIEARVDLRLARDDKYARHVLVVPEGGMGVYDRPHPLPPQRL